MVELTLAELLTRYNKLAQANGRPILKGLRNRAVGFAKIKELEGLETGINLPFLGIKHAVRKNSMRGRMVEAMRSGATMDQLKAVYHQPNREGKKDQIPLVIRTLHRYYGFGVRQEGDTFYLVEA